MKKILCLLTCLATQTVYANAASNNQFTGFYVSGAVGASSAQFDVSPHFEGEIPFSFSETVQHDLNATSAYGAIGLSYLYQFHNQFLMGVQFTAGYMDAEADHSLDFNEFIPSGPVGIFIGNEFKAKLTNDFALLFKPGYVLHENTLFYGLIGPRWGNFETSVSTDFVLDSGAVITANGSDKISSYELGLTVGAGIQQRVADHFHLSLEYAYTSYREISNPAVSSELFLSGSPLGFYVDNSAEVDASTNTIMLALSYQW